MVNIGIEPLHLACISSTNTVNISGWTPLHEACSRGFISLAKNLLKAGANVNIQSMDNDTPLHDAAGHGSHKVTVG